MPRVRRYLRRRGITARIARIGRDSSSRLGRHRWVVERTLGWLLSYKRLALRYDRSAVRRASAQPTAVGISHASGMARTALTVSRVRHLRRHDLYSMITNADVVSVWSQTARQWHLGGITLR